MENTIDTKRPATQEMTLTQKKMQRAIMGALAGSRLEGDTVILADGTRCGPLPNDGYMNREEMGGVMKQFQRNTGIKVHARLRVKDQGAHWEVWSDKFRVQNSSLWAEGGLTEALAELKRLHQVGSDPNE